MAAIDLSSATGPGWRYTYTAATTWQEFILPPTCLRFCVEPESIGAYVAGPKNGAPASPEIPADGGAVGNHRSPAAADGSYEEPIRPGGQPGNISIFVAAQSGTPTITIVLDLA
tara:strand:+ start:2503 stop:2844 length:342 start_codon:yes stop_codon:yes gene_type:complete